MASVGNKINKLVSTSENDLTAELEIPAYFPDERDLDDQDPEAGPNACAFDEPGVPGETDDALNGARNNGSDSRADSIDRLQVDIDQLREKWADLEQEIEARETITDNLNAQINQLNEKLKASASELEQARKSAEQSSAENELIREAARKDELKIQDLEKQVAAREEKIGSLELQLQESWSHQKEANEKIDLCERQIAELEQQLATQISAYEDLKADNHELREVIHNDAEKEIARSHKLIAQQAGLLAGHEQEISELSAQISRTEQYADELRHKFQEQSEIAASAVDQMQNLQTTCAAAQEKIGDLSTKLADAEQKNTTLMERIGKAEKEFAKEVRQLRFELGAAQETITDQDTINVQLTSTLYDSKGFQQSLEKQLNDAEEQYQQKIRDLEQEANKLKNQVEDFEYRLENKDSAISALMAELASRSDSFEAIGEIESVIHEIDDRMSERLDEQDEGDRERVTRQLVGESDGQELRFPLFKDRLTIGRTVHNDIQLDAQCISRRHAVIVTEHGSTKIVDWGSKNGVFINEKRVAEQILKNGDLVMIGTTEFRYEERPKR